LWTVRVRPQNKIPILSQEELQSFSSANPQYLLEIPTQGP
jgi:hypothetical protein